MVVAVGVCTVAVVVAEGSVHTLLRCLWFTPVSACKMRFAVGHAQWFPVVGYGPGLDWSAS